MSNAVNKRTIICKSCGLHFEIDKDAEVDYYFYQVKQMGNIKYTVDYNFCSKPCMMKYSKVKVGEAEKKALLQQIKAEIESLYNMGDSSGIIVKMHAVKVINKHLK